MQVNSVNNYQNNNPNFTAFKPDFAARQNLIKTFRNDCNSTDLLKILQTLRGQCRNSNHIEMTSIDRMGGHPVFGYFEAAINGNKYENGNMFNTSAWNIRKFIKKLAKIAEKKNPNPLTKVEKKAVKLDNKAELYKQQARLLMGDVKESDLREELILRISQYI